MCPVFAFLYKQEILSVLLTEQGFVPGETAHICQASYESMSSSSTLYPQPSPRPLVISPARTPTSGCMPVPWLPSSRQSLAPLPHFRTHSLNTPPCSSLAPVASISAVFSQRTLGSGTAPSFCLHPQGNRHARHQLASRDDCPVLVAAIRSSVRQGSPLAVASHILSLDPSASQNSIHPITQHPFRPSTPPKGNRKSDRKA